MAIQSACKKDGKPKCDVEELVKEQRTSTPLSKGGLVVDPIPSMFVGAIGAGIVVSGMAASAFPAGSTSVGAAGGPTIFQMPRPLPLRRAG